MLRVLDIIIAFWGLVLFCPILTLIIIIGWFETGSPFFRQIRIGQNKALFTLIKFRTMHLNTPEIPSHEISINQITKTGTFLRRTKIDELPQLWNVLRGEMSIVGPRPCLPTQAKLIEARSKHKVFAAKPGITGLAQINGIDMSDPKLLVTYEQRLIANLNFTNYIRYIALTLIGKGYGDKIKKL